MKLAYVSGALTNMNEEERQKLRVFYENLGEICRKHGFEPYIPHLYGDPKRVAHLTAEQIDHIDRQAVTQSFFVVAYVGTPSIGVGIEVELAHHADKPVILLYEKRKLEERRISRLVRGNPAVVMQILFEDFPDALRKFDEGLRIFRDNFQKLEWLPPPLKP